MTTTSSSDSTDDARDAAHTHAGVPSTTAAENDHGTTPAQAASASAPSASDPDSASERRYPDYLMDFPPDLDPAQARQWQRFFDLREDILLDYGYQTARAYWADLQDLFEWAVARDKDVLALTGRDLTQYRALLRRRKYSEHTIRRRMVTWRKLAERVSQG